MKQKGLYCEVCGNRLGVANANTMCGAACRQKRSRDKREALKRSIKAAEHIEGILKMVTQGVMTTAEARKNLYEINNSLHKLWDKISEVDAAAEAKAQK